MKPPICAVCRKRFVPGEKAGLVSFSLSEEDKAYNKRFREPGFVGHKRGKAWFCAKHYPRAVQLRHLTLGEVLRTWKK